MGCFAIFENIVLLFNKINRTFASFKPSLFFKLFLWSLIFTLFLSNRLCFSEDTKLKPLDIYSIHLYVTPRAVAKADSGFATRHFTRSSATGKFERKFKIDVDKNRPVFEYTIGYVRINNGPKRQANWRYRGLLDAHWKHPFPYRSIKIRFPEEEADLSFSIINLNHIETDPLLHDLVGHEIYHLYGSITPRMKLVKFYVNDQYAGFKILVEDVNDDFLRERGLPKGSIYRENTQAELGMKTNSGVNYYKYWWKKKSLRMQDNWEDWVHLNSLLALGRQDAGEYLLDKKYYLKWLALGLFMPIYHMNIHNLYLYHNFENQKWYSIPWDMTTAFYGPIANEYITEAKDICLLSLNKIYTSVLVNPYNYHERNKLAWELLNNDSFFSKTTEIADKVYQDYIEEIDYCREHLSEYEESPFHSLNLKEITTLKEQLPALIEARRAELKSILMIPPEIEATFDGKKIIIKGTSLVSFKIKKNGWSLKKYENLTMVSDNKDESRSLVHFVNTLDRAGVSLQPKPFYIELELAKKANHKWKPQIASLFSSRYRELPMMKEVKGSLKKEAAKFTFMERLTKPWSNLWNTLKNKDIFSKLNNREYVKVYLEHIILLLDKMKKRNYLEEGKVIRWKGEEILRRTTIVPFNSTLILEPGTVLRLGRKVSLIVEGTLIAKGTRENKVLITSISDNPGLLDYWGSICFIHSLSQDSSMTHTVVEYGGEVHIKGIYCTGALSVYHIPFRIENCEFRYNRGDDAVNFKYSVARVENSKFHHNKSDGIDFDFSKATVERGDFYANGNDGVDCGTSIVEITRSVFSEQKDKAVSVGEESDVKIHNNIFQKNNIGVAVKDSSLALIADNVFRENKYAIKAYIKKAKYKKPEYKLSQNDFSNNIYNLQDKELE